MYNTKFPDWDVATATSPGHKFNGQLAYSYAKRGQVLLAEQWAAEAKASESRVKYVSVHPGWTDTPGVEAAFGSKKKYLEPMRTMWQGTEGIAWLCAAPADKIEPGAFYLDRTPQPKHIAGYVVARA
jgi:dehydrogenase/reductase SDR family protein 12